MNGIDRSVLNIFAVLLITSNLSKYFYIILIENIFITVMIICHHDEYFPSTPKLRFSESRFSEQKPTPLIVFYTIHCLGLVKFPV